MNAADYAVRARCTRFLSHHQPVDAASTLSTLAAHPAAALRPDSYGEGGAVELLEQRTIALLGKPAGRFFIKGVSAQMSVLSAYAEARGARTVALHPMSHLDHDEANAIERVGQMVAVRLGRHAPFGVEDLARVTAPLAAVVVELPLRRAGYLLPEYEALAAISEWCRMRGVPLHVDGARLWEAAAGYGVALSDLAALADSVYVSFYKGLGGLGGALVAGSVEFVASLARWKTRYGGDLATAYPQAISALIGLDAQLPRMADYVARARALADTLRALPHVHLQPVVPHTNAFQLWLPGNAAALAERHRRFAAERKIWLFGAFQPAPLAGYTIAEIVLGDASDHYAAAEAAEWIATFLALPD